VIIVPAATEEAKAEITRRRNARLLITGGMPDPRKPGWNIRSIAGGFLLQSRDAADADALDLKVVTRRQPTPAQIADLKFAFRVCKHVKSNAVVYVKNGATVGIGAGQMSRVDSARIAAIKAQDAAKAAGHAEPLTVGSVAASDAFFPFPDGLLAVVEAGATAIIQPGGSLNDKEVIAAADDAGIAMVFSGVRQFRH
ncbi:MAG TPA: bifunctional phosphoribosylaminoimidazolecarboxamide formyltransferase/IMP cyclohydrolase, partial [Alphaproteobacteria bacterium]|nr:bifunctional phosphoribosylaminoimidazolecarboxamide formyltransferase/IMP cyclohydrolase [Alphaproteobacteria bacterium]